MKKKSLLFLALALALSLCLALVACADKNKGVNKLTAESGITADGVFESGSAPPHTIPRTANKEKRLLLR